MARHVSSTGTPASRSNRRRACSASSRHLAHSARSAACAAAWACSQGRTATSLFGTSCPAPAAPIPAGYTSVPRAASSWAAARASATSVWLPAYRSLARRASAMNGWIGPKVNTSTASGIVHLRSLRELLRDPPLDQLVSPRGCAAVELNTIGEKPRLEQRGHRHIAPCAGLGQLQPQRRG